jgi:thiosulfate dehydrogenase
MKKRDEEMMVRTANGIVISVLLVLAVCFCAALLLTVGPLWLERKRTIISNSDLPNTNRWKAPETSSIPKGEKGKLVRYGRELILHTDRYFGPKGKISAQANGMMCTNCHLNGGTKFYGNNFSAVASTYPKYRPRYGAVESISMRINDCIVRSLNGKRIDVNKLEMRAMVAYMVWIGKDVKKGESPDGSGLKPVDFLDRPADPVKGNQLFAQKCAFCHGNSGEGLKNKDGSWLNPPVWGNQSYTIGAGMYRLSRLAFFIKSNMPWGVNADTPQLTDEEAWDIAAYINSMPRPGADLSKDWPDLSTKPFDHPFGPYIDNFTEERRKYGPYQDLVRSTKLDTAKEESKIKKPLL